MDDWSLAFETLVDAAGSDRFDHEVARSRLMDAVPRLHPLNFVALRTDDGAGTALRLHLWDERFAFGQTGFEVHDHSFDFESYVLAGSVEQTVFEARIDDQGDRRTFEVGYAADGGSDLVPTGSPMTLDVTERRTFTRGDRYRLPHGVLHGLHLLSRSAATLVLTRDRGSPPVTIGERGAKARSTARPIVTDYVGNPMTLEHHTMAQIADAAAKLR